MAHRQRSWICPRCLVADIEDALFDVICVHLTREDAEQDLLSEEFYASLDPPEPEIDAVLPQPCPSSRQEVSTPRTSPMSA
jgi:hypothetical protein